MNKTIPGYRFVNSDNTGAALIITLLLLTFLTGLVVEFAYGVYIGTAALANWSDAQRASLIAKSGQSMASLYMKELQNVSYTYQDDVLLPVEYDFGLDSRLTIRLEDENAKFNINSIIYKRGAIDPITLESLKKLFEFLDIDPSLALSIADWIDSDSEPQIGDSEMNAKNAPLWDIGEIHYINGIDDEMFARISPFLTVYGDNRININTAELPVLVSLNREMTEELAEKIIYYRENAPFEDKSHIIHVSGLESLGIKISDRITVKSNVFRVISRAEVNGTKRTIESVLDTAMTRYWREG